jgi:hypothetical protein
MGSVGEITFGIAHLVATYVALPSLTIWGWARWSRKKKPQNTVAIFSLAGLLLATVSVLLAISSILYSMATGGFAYHAPALMSIFGWGSWISIAALALALVGIWRASPIRWHALACSLGALLFWFGAGMAE